MATPVTTTFGIGSPGKGRHFYVPDLSNAETTVFSEGSYVKDIIIEGGAAAEIVIFRAGADTPVWFRVPVAIAGHVHLHFGERGVYFPTLEVICASAAGDVSVAVFYA